MSFNKEEAIKRWKSLTPEQRKKAFANLCRAVGRPDLIPIEEMTNEEVDAELRRQGFTDEDFKRMNEKINNVLNKYKSIAENKEVQND